MSDTSAPLGPERFIVGSEGGKIGVAVRKRGGFEFLSAHDDFAPLDGRVFPRAKSLVMEVTRHAQRTRRRQARLASGRETGLW